MTQSYQQDWNDFRAAMGQPTEWVWVCKGCGKTSVMPKSRDRIEQRADGHRISCQTNGNVEIEPAEQ